MNQYFTEGQQQAITEIIESRLQNISNVPKPNFKPVAAWCSENSISISKLYSLKNKGEVTFYNFGKNVFVKVDEIERLMKAQ